jgi:hypothetical protein
MSVSVVKSFLVNFKGWPHVRSTTRCVAIKDVLYLLNDLIRIKHNMDMKEIMKVSGSFFAINLTSHQDLYLIYCTSSWVTSAYIYIYLNCWIF